MNIWKIGSRWSNDGNPDSSVVDIFRKYNIVFAGRETAYIKRDVKSGDFLAVTDGITVVSVGIVIGTPKPITEFEFEEIDIASDRFEYEDSVIAFKVILFDLEEWDRFDYRQGTFNKMHGKHEGKIKELVGKELIIETPNIYSSEQKTYALKQFKIHNFQGIKNIHIKSIPTDAQWIFLTGENGYGKTSVLRSIVIGMYGNKDENTLLDQRNEIFTMLELKTEDKNQINRLRKFDFKRFERFAAYGTSRLNKNSKGINKRKTFSLFNSNGELLDIEDAMIKWEKDEHQKIYYKNVRATLLKLLSPYITNIRIERKGMDSTVKYTEKENDRELVFNELASGFRSIIAMAGDIILRLSTYQPENINNLSGIVIVDEFDLHLHPIWQKKIVMKFTEIFPNIQFIVSTHSPIPILGAPKNSILLLVNRTREEGITVEKLDINLAELLPENMLSSPIFNFQDIFPASNEKGERIRTEKGYDELIFNKILESKLQKIAEEAGIKLKKNNK